MPATVKVRTETFTRTALAAGLDNHAQIAEAMGVARSTVGRVLAGALAPGGAFIGAALLAFPASTFEDLFEPCP